MSERAARVLTWPSGKLRGIKQHFSGLTPHQKWKSVIGSADFILKLLGINVLSDCKRNWRTPIAGICALQYKVLVLYTIWYYWDENKITSVQGLTMLSLDAAVTCDFGTNMES